MLTLRRDSNQPAQRGIRLAFCVFLFCTLLNPSAPPARADDVGGLIDVDTTWNLAGSPYIVVEPVLVMEGVTLTIEPGVEVKFDSHKSLQIQGELIAMGTSNQPIIFTSNSATPAAGDWDYIFFADNSVDAAFDIAGNYASGSILQHTVIEYAGGSTVENNAALRMDGASPFVTFTTICYSANNAIFAFYIDEENIIKLTHNVIAHNAGKGIEIVSGWDEYPTYAEISDSLLEYNISGHYTIVIDNEHGMSSHYFEKVVVRNNVFRWNQFERELIRITAAELDFADNWITENSVYNCPLCWDHFLIQLYPLRANVSDNVVFNNSLGGFQGTFLGEVAQNVVSDNLGTALKLTGMSDSEPITITHNTILRNTAPNNVGMIYENWRTSNGGLIESNTFVDNLNSGETDLRTVYINQVMPTFNDNNFSGNNGYTLYNNLPQSAPNLNAENNWWGTIGSSNIAALIFDWFDDSSKGIVDYSPYRTAWNPDAPISPPSGFSLTPETASITLSWSPNPESDLAGYKVYYDTDAGYPYEGAGADQGNSPIDVGNVITYTLSGLQPGVIYYFAVTAYDNDRDGDHDWTDGNESWFSLEEQAGVGLPPVAEFSAAPTSGDSPLVVNFTNESTGAITACLWDFGDGETSLECNDPSHTYQLRGVYTVELTVVGPNGEDARIRPDYINVTQAILAGFIGTPTSGNAPLQVDFTNQSLGDYTTCAWDFGDGGTDSNCNNPSHTYTSVGIYSVELTVQGLSGSDTLTRVDYIQVTHEAIEADFSGAPTNGIAPLRVDFTNQSFGPFTSCLWEFGDGETDSDCNNPSHTYRMGGEYTVTLTIYNDFGNDALTIPDYIKVQYGLYLPLVVRLSP